MLYYCTEGAKGLSRQSHSISKSFPARAPRDSFLSFHEICYNYDEGMCCAPFFFRSLIYFVPWLAVKTVVKSPFSALAREKQSNRTHPGQLNAKRSPIVKNGSGVLFVASGDFRNLSRKYWPLFRIME